MSLEFGWDAVFLLYFCLETMLSIFKFYEMTHLQRCDCQKLLRNTGTLSKVSNANSRCEGLKDSQNRRSLNLNIMILIGYQR